MKIVYTGSCQKVIVPLIEGGTIEMERGKPVDVDDKIAHRLVKEKTNWQYAEKEPPADPVNDEPANTPTKRKINKENK